MVLGGRGTVGLEPSVDDQDDSREEDNDSNEDLAHAAVESRHDDPAVRRGAVMLAHTSGFLFLPQLYHGFSEGEQKANYGGVEFRPSEGRFLSRLRYR